MKLFYCSFMTKVLLLGGTLAGNLTAPSAMAAPQAPFQGVTLYRELLNPVVDPADVHEIRQVSIDREDLHVNLSDGVIGLMRAVDGHVTGAVFEGVGEILTVPPSRAERTSLGLFTGSAVLEQEFNSAYLRFFDDKLVEELKAGFRPAEDAGEFIGRWEQPIKLLAPRDVLEVLQAMMNAQDPASRFLHFRLGGTQLGVFDAYFAASAPEQITLAQEQVTGNSLFYDIWASFPMRSARAAGEPGPSAVSPFEISDYRLKGKAVPPSDLSVNAEFTLTPRRAGRRMVILELSRYLRVSEVLCNGQPVEFIQNEPVSGSERARRDDGLVGVVFPGMLEKDRPVKLSFKYAGPVMFDAGADVLYVGARGTWYPNSGPSYSSFDLSFEYPEDWLLVATGKQVSSASLNGWRTTRFASEKPISRAGFNLGKFASASSSSGNVAIHVYAAKNVEQDLAAAEARVGKHPQPDRAAQQIAAQAAGTIQFLSSELDAFPYPNLEITQLPGILSQSWPGLIYLSSRTFLDRDERRAAGVNDPFNELLLSRLMLSHETAHQWWGDAVDWASYRDEWIIEALANYSALIMLEKDDPQAMDTALDHYKRQLLRDTGRGILADAGPVTLGTRLTSSKFPGAYEQVVYGRGTWLIHMLRTMLREAGGENSDALFFAALKGVLAKSPTHKISTRDLERAFEQVLPASLEYEGSKSLDWFFDSWVNGVSIPQFDLENVRLTPAGDKMKVSGVISESQAAKDQVTAVPLYAVDEAGKSQFLAFVFADDAKTSFNLTAPAGTKQILLDPKGTLLRR